MKELYIDVGITQSRACVACDNKVIELYVENHDNENISGNIYLGRVENIVNSLNAAFVNIGIGKNAILHFEDCTYQKEIQRGKQIIVQVIREATGDKGPRVTTKLSIPGRNLVFLPDANYIGVSKKIDSEETRAAFKSLARDIVGEDGIIIRTEGEFTDPEDIKMEYILLREKWNAIKKTSEFIKAPKLLLDSRDFLDYVTREIIKHDIEVIYVNNQIVLQKLSEILKTGKEEFIDRINFNEFDFSKIKFIKKNILSILDEKISMGTGGYIVVNESEALVSIDVNSGSFTSEGSKVKTSLRINFDACIEIARVIKQRNLTGIILIDFIDMSSDREREQIVKELQIQMYADRTQWKIYGFTELGLLEMTRGRKGKRITELVYENPALREYGTAFLLKELENSCSEIFRYKKRNNIEVYISEKIMNEINSRFQDFTVRVKEVYGINLTLKQENGIKDYLIVEDNSSLEKVRVEIGNNVYVGKLEYFKEEDGTLSFKIIKV